MASYRSADRLADSKDVLEVCVAYAFDNLIYDENGRPLHVDKATYEKTPRVLRVNKFTKAYRKDAAIWLHQSMADVVVDAALYLRRKYGWTSIIYDGLRTVDGAYNVYSQMSEEDIASGIFAAPGSSAHNKGMAADVVMFDETGKLVEMGGNFDHLDMRTNSRTCTDLPQEALENRIKREIAYQHAALLNGRLFAPLRSEFWDERFPENSEDNWRVLDSLARCMGKTLLSDKDEAARRSPKGSPEREAFIKSWEQLDYEAFTAVWHKLFSNDEIRSVFDLAQHVPLPPDSSTVIYHGDFNPLYDRELVASGKHITDNRQD
jgi:D-alanyl-D-alanine dipeptidase